MAGSVRRYSLIVSTDLTSVLVLWDLSVHLREKKLTMGPPKASSTKEDLQNFKEEILHQFHIISEGVIDQVKQVAEGVMNVNEKLDRRFDELKAEIQETRQEVLA